jgi:hypothetical protein
VTKRQPPPGFAYVYCARDPRTDRVRYVGKTTQDVDRHVRAYTSQARGDSWIPRWDVRPVTEYTIRNGTARQPYERWPLPGVNIAFMAWLRDVNVVGLTPTVEI